MTFLLVLFALFLLPLVALLIWAIATFNGLVVARNGFKNAFAQIDVQLQRRYELIPNLVEVAKTYLQHERETLEAVIRARNTAVNHLQSAKQHAGEADAMQALSSAEAGLSASLGRLFALSESYPDLKANTTMLQLSEELSSTENRVAFARQAYNDAVMGYNNRREMFPGNLMATPLGFIAASPLEIAANETHKREAPKVSFGQ